MSYSDLILFVLISIAGTTIQALAGEQTAGKDRGRLDISQAVLIADPGQPAYVHYAVDDLRGYLKEITGCPVSVCTSMEAGTQPVIAVGPGVAAGVLAERAPGSKLGEEGFLIKCVRKNGRDFLVVTGATPKGTKFGVYALMRMVQANSDSAYIETPVDVQSVPSFKLRGMHLNGWPIKYPYAFRRWSEQDWQRYIDILSYQGVNLLFVWPFIEIMPVPLSKEDEVYLQEFRRVVDYAQTRHGMEVWMMQSPNRVAKSDCGVSDPRERPYWRMDVQVDMDPADPEQFQQIMNSREALYRVVNNVDGVVTIDCDPGGWPGAPVGDWAKILNGCRSLLDRCNIHGPRTELIQWLHLGWGRTTEVRLDYPMGEIIRGLELQLPGPTMFIAGWPALTRMCADEGVIGKTIAMPYSTIEGEPSYPATALWVDSIRGILGGVGEFRSDIAGAMGNAQCPLIQFPNVYYYLSCIWDYNYLSAAEKQVLLDVSGLLYPENREFIADCYAALKKQDPAEVDALATRLDELVKGNKLGRPGVLGRKLFPGPSIVAESLVMQLRFKAATERLFRVTGEGSGLEQSEKLLTAALDAYLTWESANGWRDLWQGRWPLSGIPLFCDARLPVFAARLKGLAGDAQALDRLLSDVARELSLRHDADNVAKYCTDPMRAISRAAVPISGLAQKAKATASVEPNAQAYPVSQAIDGSLSTLYWPGALVENNEEWLQLTWDEPQTFRKVVVHFLNHASMRGRTIRLQKEISPGVWQDFAAAVIPNDPKAAYAVATFDLSSAVNLDRIRVVNLLDLYEIEVH